MKGFKMLNMRDVIKSKNLSHKPGELENKRAKIVSETIAKYKSNILFGYAIRQEGQLTDVFNLIENDESVISKVLFDNGKRKDLEIEKYKKEYELHSRWLDYSPEFIQHQYENFEKVIKGIIREAEDLNVKTLAV